jgi:hypothetical protein
MLVSSKALQENQGLEIAKQNCIVDRLNGIITCCSCGINRLRVGEQFQSVMVDECRKECDSFAACAKEQSFMVVFRCREENRQSKYPTAQIAAFSSTI